MSAKKKKGYDKNVYRSFAMIMQFGINMLVPICALSALGIYIDKKLGTSFVMILLFFVGAMAGARNVYRMAKYSFTDRTEEKSKINAKDGQYAAWGDDAQAVCDQDFTKETVSGTGAGKDQLDQTAPKRRQHGVQEDTGKHPE